MKITSGRYQFCYETEELLKPDDILSAVITTVMKKAGNSAEFYIMPGRAPFLGCAFISENDTYSVCLSGTASQKGLDYLAWVIRHELRHCEPSDKHPKFRYHDVELFDIGFKPPKQIGFFNEDFEEIAVSDELKGLFCNVLHIEKYVKDAGYTKWMQDRKKWIIKEAEAEDVIKNKKL